MYIIKDGDLQSHHTKLVHLLNECFNFSSRDVFTSAEIQINVDSFRCENYPVAYILVHLMASKITVLIIICRFH